MISEASRTAHRDTEKIAMRHSAADMHDVCMTGEITDRIFKNGVLVDTIVDHNIVVNSFLKIVMALCKNQNGYGGIQYWAIGSGEAAWDTATPDPTVYETALTNEIGRVAIPASEIIFLNPSNMQQSAMPTNMIQIKHMFDTGDCNGKWREFGLFGGDATETAGSGIMVNKKHHAVITKTDDMTIERTMRFTLNLV